MPKPTLVKQVLFGRTQKLIWLCLFFVALLLTNTFIEKPIPAVAATSNTMNFQARLLTSSGSVVPDGYYNAEFKLYSQSSGGSALWTETYYDSNGVTAGNDNRVRVVNGYLTVNLNALNNNWGSVTDWSEEMWLTMNIGGTGHVSNPTWDGEMSPRLKLTAVPYAFEAANADKLGGIDANQYAQLGANQTFTGNNVFQPNSNSTTAFQLQNAGGQSFFNYDSTNQRIGIGGGNDAPIYGLDVRGSSLGVSVGDTAALVVKASIYSSVYGLAVDTINSTVTTNYDMTVESATNSTAAFQVLRNGGSPLFTVDTTNDAVYVSGAGGLTLGSGGTVDGSLAFASSNNGNRLILQGGGVEGIGDATITIPTINTGEDDFVCLQILNNCSAGASTLQEAYNGSTDPEITLDSTRGGLTVRDDSSAIGGNLLEVQNNDRTINYLSVAASGTTIQAGSAGVKLQDLGGNTMFHADTNNAVIEVSGDIYNAGLKWTSPSTTTPSNLWSNITYGNGLYVAVSLNGTGNRVMTSPDGINWTARTSAADNAWNSITYGNGLFVAVAGSGTGNRVMTSPDGINWTARTSAADNSWRSVTYGNGLFVAVAATGTGNQVMTSPDGINWTSRSESHTGQWFGVTYGNGLFVAVAWYSAGNRIMTSPDGINWTSQAHSTSNSWASVTYANGLFVAVGGPGGAGVGVVMTSPDGVTWTTRTAAEENYWNSVTYGNGLFVAVSTNGTNRIMTSPDGINWTARKHTTNTSWGAVTFGNGMFVSVAQSGGSGRIMLSGKPDAIITPHNNIYQGGMQVYGDSTFKSGVNSTTAFQIQGSTGNSVFNVDTQNGRIGVGTNAPARQVHVALNTTDTNAMPLLVEQSGNGDSGIEIKNNAQSYYVGIDSSDSNKFKIGSSSAAGSQGMLGYSVVEGSVDVGITNVVGFTRGTASITGNITTIKAYINSSGAGNVKMQAALYADNGTRPNGAALGVSNEVNATAGSNWYTFTIPSVSVTSGTKYWIGYTSNGENNNYYASAPTHESCYYTYTYSTGSFPNVGGCTTSATKRIMYAVIDSPGGASDNLNTSLFELGTTGAAKFQNSTNSTAAFQIQNSAGSSLFNVDTTNSLTTMNGAALIQSTTNNTNALRVVNASGAQLLNVDTTNSNIIANGSFEGTSGTTGWAKYNGAETAFATTSADAYTGTQSLMVTNNATSDRGVKYNLTTTTLSSNSTYSFTFSAKVRTGDEAINSNLFAGRSDNGSSDTGCSGAAGVRLTDKWTTFTCQFTTGTTSNTPYVFIKQTDSVARTIYIDGVQLIKESILANSSMEESLGASNWQAKGSPSNHLLVTDAYYDGVNSLRVQTNGTANQGTRQNKTLATNTTYTLSFYAATGSGTWSTLSAGYSSDGSTDNTACMTNQTIDFYAGWSNFTCSFTTPGSTSGTPYIYIKNSGATNNIMYLDAIRLTQGSSTPQVGGYREGTIALNGIISSPTVFQNQTNSTTAFRIQNASGANIITADSVSNRVFIGSANTTTLNADLVVKSVEIQTALRVGDATNGFSFNDAVSGKLRLSGTARNTKKVVMTPEYAGAVLDGTGTGTMTAGYDGTQRTNYYKWTTTQVTSQAYDVVITTAVPSDWSAWAASNAISVSGWTSHTTNSTGSLTVISTNGTTDVNATSITPGSTSTWTTTNANLTSSNIYTADGTMVIRLRVTANNNSSFQLGNVTLTYLSQF